jgi:hypothetical protein
LLPNVCEYKSISKAALAFFGEEKIIFHITLPYSVISNRAGTISFNTSAIVM